MIRAASSTNQVWIGTAGWSIPRHSAHRTEQLGSHLERYARLFSCVEINSSFYRSHAVTTYARWAAATPAGFRFAVKMPRAITHEQQLQQSQALLTQFCAETSGLGDKRGPILVQLPPSLDFNARVAGRFFRSVREQVPGAIVCEPRHPTWFTAPADRLLQRYQVSRVAADPPRAEGSDGPGGWAGLVYFRLHGSPRTYWSNYSTAYLEDLAHRLRTMDGGVDRWVIFDNTAAGAAFENAWELRQGWKTNA